MLESPCFGIVHSATVLVFGVWAAETLSRHTSREILQTAGSFLGRGIQLRCKWLQRCFPSHLVRRICKSGECYQDRSGFWPCKFQALKIKDDRSKSRHYGTDNATRTGMVMVVWICVIIIIVIITIIILAVLAWSHDSWLWSCRLNRKPQ